MSQASPPTFAVIPGTQVREVLYGNERQVIDVVEKAYRLHDAGGTVNPDSYFLRFPDRPTDRIIALPSSAAGDIGVHGVKWISSFPGNVAAGLPRASAVLVLNDPETGYPFACLEGSIVSAARTAASAALAAQVLSDQRGARPVRAGFFGTGLISRYVHTYLAACGLGCDEVGVYDLSPEHAEGFAGYLRRGGHAAAVTVYDKPEDLIRSADLVVFATTAATPHVTDPQWFGHHPLVLHLSLRDLSTDVILAADNVTDDVEHSMKAATSLHLTEQRVGHRGFVAGTLCSFLTGDAACAPDRTTVFSPFGLGVLDLAVGKHVYDQVAAEERMHQVPGFFAELCQYG